MKRLSRIALILSLTVTFLVFGQRTLDALPTQLSTETEDPNEVTDPNEVIDPNEVPDPNAPPVDPGE